MDYGELPFELAKGVAMKRLILVVPLALILSGCTHYFVHPTKKPAEFSKDKAECEKIADRESARRGTRPCDEAEKCLMGKGWRRD
jgi:hypothetical protein